MSEIKIFESDSLEAETIWNNSPHSTIFTNPKFLKKIAKNVRWYIAKKISGNDDYSELLCAWPLCFDNHGKSYLPPFCYYIGPIWSYTSLSTPIHRKLSLETSVYESYIEKFENDFKGFVSSFPIGIHDVRIFDWWNYHNKDKNRVIIQPKYTAIIENLENENLLKENYRKVRRYEIRQIEKLDNLFIDNQASFNEILSLYRQTLGRQELEVSKDYLDTLEKIIDFINESDGEILAIRDKQKAKSIFFVSLVLRSKKISNLILNATDKNYRSIGLPAYGIHNTIKKAAELGDEIFDFNGANSPRRGDDKHSYGALVKLYFELSHKT